METIRFDKDIKVFYITADSFPEGILAAHQQLHGIVPFSAKRKYFGISRPEQGDIVYRAAVEELTPGEAEKLHCDTLTLKKGNYINIRINDYQKDPESIERAFQQLLSEPDLDSKGYCVEWYLNDKDVNCMIRVND